MADHQNVHNTLGAMKYVYDTSAVDLINLQAPTYSRMKKGGGYPPGGLGFTTSIKTQSNFRGGVRNEVEALPDKGYFSYQKPVVTPKYIYHLAEITGPAKAKAGGAKMAFLNLLPKVLSEAVDVYGWLRNHAVFRDGKGVLGTVSGAVASDTATMDTIEKNYNILIGMYVDAVDPTYPTTGNKDISGIRISNKSSVSANTITFAASQTADDGVQIVLKGNRDTTMGKEELGFDAMFDDGTNTDSYFGVARTSYPSWRGNLITAASERVITIKLLQDAYNMVRRHVGNKVGNLELITNDGQEMQVADIILPTQRHVDTTKFRLGWTGLTFKIYPFIIDIMCPRRKIYYSNWDTMERKVLEEATWSNLGEMWFSHHGLSTAFDKFTAMYHCYEELFCENPGANAIIDMLKEPS